MKYWLIAFGIYLFGCTSDVPESEAEFIESEAIELNEDRAKDSVSITEDKSLNKQINNTKNDLFLDCYNGIVLGIGMHNDSLFNSLIHNNYGLYTIESSGAMPMIRKFYDIRKFKTFNENKDINELLYHEMSDPIFESLPKVICDVEVYDKEGCFAQETNPLLESQIWNYAGLNEKEIQATETLAKTIRMTVVNTSNFTFYFSKIEGKWYLTFIDFRVPCTA